MQLEHERHWIPSNFIRFYSFHKCIAIKLLHSIIYFSQEIAIKSNPIFPCVTRWVPFDSAWIDIFSRLYSISIHKVYKEFCTAHCRINPKYSLHNHAEKMSLTPLTADADAGFYLLHCYHRSEHDKCSSCHCFVAKSPLHVFRYSAITFSIQQLPTTSDSIWRRKSEPPTAIGMEK